MCISSLLSPFTPLLKQKYWQPVLSFKFYIALFRLFHFNYNCICFPCWSCCEQSDGINWFSHFGIHWLWKSCTDQWYLFTFAKKTLLALGSHLFFFNKENAFLYSPCVLSVRYLEYIKYCFLLENLWFFWTLPDQCPICRLAVKGWNWCTYTDTQGNAM